MAIKSYYHPINPKKYIGNINNVLCRSGWERKYCRFLDTNKHVLKWCIEPFPIKYFYEVDKTFRRYFPDFIVKTAEKVFIIEIKPKKQTKPPKGFKNTGNPVKDRKKKYKYIEESKTYTMNKNKWDAAKQFCKDKGMIFKVITEKELF